MKKIVIIGAGINGVAIARKIARNTNNNIEVIDQEQTTGFHASTRNSGVIHAGFYYSSDTIKALLCAKGNKRLRAYCEDNNIQVNKCGKVVVSRNTKETKVLELLYERGRTNGCTVELKKQSEIAKYEKTAKTVEKFLWSPNTWSTSPTEVMNKLERECKELGVMFTLGKKVVTINEDHILFNDDTTISYDFLINASGGSTLKIYKLLSNSIDLEMMPFKGLYLKSIRKRDEFKAHIYPVPDIQNPFLGVHTTLTVDGHLKLGPTAIPALSWDNYRGLEGINMDSLKILREFAGAFARNDFNLRSLAFKEFRNYIKNNIIIQVGKITSAKINSKEFEWNIPGIRAQLYDKGKRELVNDFIIKKHKNTIHILNSVSPAWTCALENAEYIFKLITDEL